MSDLRPKIDRSLNFFGARMPLCIDVVVGRFLCGYSELRDPKRLRSLISDSFDSESDLKHFVWAAKSLRPERSQISDS